MSARLIRSVMRRDETPHSYMVRRAREVTRAAVDMHGTADAFKSVKAMTTHTAKEYEGRFLYELIQNAYDRHPEERNDGQVAIVFDSGEGEHGTLYFANGGDPVTWRNALAFSNLGLSDKPIGVGIGHKGVGFKSVLQICDTPEVYSVRDADDQGFGGFAFRFATHADFLSLVDGDRELFAILEEDLSLYNVLIPLEEAPQQALDLRRRGFVTVVRLPARSALAAQQIRDALDGLLGLNVPVMLFLRRLSRLIVERPADDQMVVLGRVPRPGPGGVGEIVNLRRTAAQRDDLDTNSSFHVFTQTVDPVLLKDTLETSVADGVLDEAWLKWTSPARVGVAIPRDPEVAAFRCYTYLPMGEHATSPLPGFVNAPFVTNFSRLDLKVEHPVNMMLLDAVADLCLDAAANLRQHRQLAECKVALDLVCWSDPDTWRHLTASCKRLFGQGLLDHPLLPVRSASGEHESTSMSDPHAWMWPQKETLLVTPARVGTLDGTRLIDIDIVSGARRVRLLDLAQIHECTLEPSVELLAEWVEAIARTLPRTAEDLKTWDELYADLPVLFPKNAVALEGKRILLSRSLDLTSTETPSHPGERGQARQRRKAVFFPPVVLETDDEDVIDETVDVSPPASLEGQITYLHPDLNWYDERRVQTPARQFLQDRRLARRFRTSSLLEHVRSLLIASKDQRLRRDCLRFLFALHRAKPGAFTKELGEAGLYIPNRSSQWIRADEALFSHGWPETSGDDLSLIASVSADLSPSLAELSHRLIAPTEEIVSTGSTIDQWRAFLRLIGVKDIIPVNWADETRRIYGRTLVREHLAKNPNLPENIASTWMDVLPLSGSWAHPETVFHATTPVAWLPGQAEIATLPRDIRISYARLVIRSLGSWPENHFTTVWQRDRPNGTSTSAPTPLWAFLKCSPWMPIHKPLVRLPDFERLSKSWYLRGDSDEALPPYSPLIDTSFRNLIDRKPQGLSRLKLIGMPVWGEPESAGRLVLHLGELLNCDSVADVHIPQFRNTYSDAWGQVANSSATVFRGDKDAWIVVESGDRVELVKASAKPETGSPEQRIYVASSDDDSTRIRVIKELGWPMLRVNRHGASRVVQILAARLGDRAVDAAHLQFQVVSEGRPWAASSADPLLVDLLPWLSLVVACVLEFPGRATYRAGERRFHEILERLARIRVSCAHRLSVEIDGHQHALPTRVKGVLPIAGTPPTLAIERNVDELTWETASKLADPLLELLETRVLAERLTLALVRMEQRGVRIESGPSHLEIADELGVSLEQVKRTEARLYGATGSLLIRLHPVVAHLTSEKWAEPFRVDGGDLMSHQAIADALGALIGEGIEDPQQLLQAAKETQDLDALRRALGIELGPFNRTLAGLTPPLRPIDYQDDHAATFDYFVKARRKELLGTIRWARLEQFQHREPQEDWLQLRSLAGLTPDQAWNLTTDKLTESQMQTRVTERLTSLLGMSPPSTGPILADIDDVARTNGLSTQKHLSMIMRLVLAWAAKAGVALPDPGNDGQGNLVGVRARLDSIGALDFEPLAELDILGWLSSLHMTPPGMPVSLDLTALGLTDADLGEHKSEAQRQLLERERQRRTISFNDTELDVSDSLATLADHVGKNLARNPEPLSLSLRLSRLQVIPERGRAQRPGHASPSPSGRQSRLSDLQKDAIGFAGEWIVYHWLKLRFPKTFGPECWMSTLRRHVFSDGGGIDGAGYDFKVPHPRGGFNMFEVKATKGDAGQFELGESEVAAAQDSARNRRWQIVVVEHALDEVPTLHLLPNPFHPESRGLYDFVGEGLRLRYRLE